jgi:hypothetical protein
MLWHERGGKSEADTGFPYFHASIDFTAYIFLTSRLEGGDEP